MATRFHAVVNSSGLIRTFQIARFPTRLTCPAYWLDGLPLDGKLKAMYSPE